MFVKIFCLLKTGRDKVFYYFKTKKFIAGTDCRFYHASSLFKYDLLKIIILPFILNK
jgi:hypothetical protein